MFTPEICCIINGCLLKTLHVDEESKWDSSWYIEDTNSFSWGYLIKFIIGINEKNLLLAYRGGYSNIWEQPSFGNTCWNSIFPVISWNLFNISGCCWLIIEKLNCLCDISCNLSIDMSYSFLDNSFKIFKKISFTYALSSKYNSI